MKYTKPALTFEQQADLLIARGMLGDRSKMIDRLSHVNYYRLSAYWYTFRVDGTEELKPGTHFDHIWDRYVFDQRLRFLVMEAIERIEVGVRTQCAYYHSHRYGPFAYAADPSSLPGLNPHGGEDDNNSHAAFLKEVRSCVKRGKEALFVKHFRAKYTSERFLPIWMVTELMSLGTVARMYKGCGNPIRQPIAAQYGLKIKEFESWLVTLNDVRNICAHHSRLWNRKLVKAASLPPIDPWMTPVLVDATTVFAALTMCSHLLAQIAPDTTWHKRVRSLIEEYPSIPKEKSHRGWTMGLPDNWLDCPIWAAAR
jgi:abortive infection bacteriophage resistance protein